MLIFASKPLAGRPFGRPELFDEFFGVAEGLDARSAREAIVIIGLNWRMADLIGGFDDFSDIIGEPVDLKIAL